MLSIPSGIAFHEDKDGYKLASAPSYPLLHHEKLLLLLHNIMAYSLDNPYIGAAVHSFSHDRAPSSSAIPIFIAKLIFVKFLSLYAMKCLIVNQSNN